MKGRTTLSTQIIITFKSSNIGVRNHHLENKPNI